MTGARVVTPALNFKGVALTGGWALRLLRELHDG